MAKVVKVMAKIAIVKKSKVVDTVTEDTTKVTSGEIKDDSVSTAVTSDSQASTDDKGEVQKKNE